MSSQPVLLVERVTREPCTQLRDVALDGREILVGPRLAGLRCSFVQTRRYLRHFSVANNFGCVRISRLCTKKVSERTDRGDVAVPDVECRETGRLFHPARCSRRWQLLCHRR